MVTNGLADHWQRVIRSEGLRRALWAVVLLMIAANVVTLSRHLRFGEVNQDEFQHLHVAWETLRGHLIFRDFFEHHGPLFAFGNALILGLLAGEPSFGAIDALRMSSALAVVVTAILLARFVLRWTSDGLQAVLAVALFTSSPIVLRHGVQPRPDEWVAIVALLAADALLRQRPLRAGIWMGVAVGLHPKALIFAVPMLAALVVSESATSSVDFRSVVRSVASSVGGLLVVPLVLAVGFAASGGLGAFFEGMWGFNTAAVASRIVQVSPMLGKPLVRLWEKAPGFTVFVGAGVLASLLVGLRGNDASGRPVRTGRGMTLAFTPFVMLPAFPYVLMPALPFLSSVAAFAPDGLRRWLTPAAFAVSMQAVAVAWVDAPREAAPAVDVQRRLVERIRREAAPDEPVLYVWPSNCAAYMFQPDPGWMWMLGASYGIAGTDTAIDRASKEAYRKTFDAMRAGKYRWLALDDREFRKLPEAEARFLTARFERDDCLWHRRDAAAGESPR